MNTTSIVLLLTRNIYLFVVTAGRDQHCLGMHVTASCLQSLYLAFINNFSDLTELNISPEAFSLLAKVFCQIEALKTFGKTRIVIYPISHCSQTPNNPSLE